MKAFADNKINVLLRLKFALGRVYVFRRLLFMGHLKTGLCDKELSHFYSVVQEYFPLDHNKILSSGKVLF